MKKLFVLSFSLLAVLALASAPAINACDGCDTHKASAELKQACSASATKTASKSCTPEELAACAKAKGMTAAEFAKNCGDKKDCDFAVIDIKGMTCGSCETSVTTALTELEGVNKVIKVSYEEAVAWVCFDPAKCKTDAMTAAVTDKGFKAEIIPAVAKTSMISSESKFSGCSKSKTAGSSCGAKKGDKKVEEKSEGTSL